MFRALILASILVSCAREDVKPPSDTTYQDLAEKAAIYESELETHRDEYGFIMTDKCDATLFSGLLGAAYPGTVDLMAAFDGEKWHRRPGQDCGPDFGNSGATFSRDMMLGVMWWMWENKKVEEVEQLMDILVANNYIMPGDGPLSRMAITPGMINTLALMSKGLGGPIYPVEMTLFPAIFFEGGGYASHLAVWHILLRGKITRSIKSSELEIIENLMKREPQNPLYTAAYHVFIDGDQTKAAELLMDESHWPNDRLPSTSEHCAEWAIQRDKGKDWEPCPEENKTFTGADWLVVYKILIERK